MKRVFWLFSQSFNCMGIKLCVKHFRAILEVDKKNGILSLDFQASFSLNKAELCQNSGFFIIFFKKHFHGPLTHTWDRTRSTLRFLIIFFQNLSNKCTSKFMSRLKIRPQTHIIFDPKKSFKIKVLNHFFKTILGFD